MEQNAPDIPALFTRLEESFRQTEKLLAELLKIYPLYSCALPQLYVRQIAQTEKLLEIKRNFETHRNRLT